MSKPRVIALYLPQFHPFPENDEWWGKGYTEWNSVVRAKPLFKGHNQPNVPSDLGFYDLRLPVVREQQAELAREAGIEGFCYWHYWFGNGKQLMADIFDDVLASGKPDFPFCLGWANHSWYAKNWNNNDTKGSDRLLIEQTYPGKKDIRMHYEYVLKAFKDPRYIKVGNKPFFMIFIADELPEDFIGLWNEWAREDGFDGIYFVGNAGAYVDASYYTEKGFSAVIKDRMREQLADRYSHFTLGRAFRKIKGMFTVTAPNLFDYKDCIKRFIQEQDDCREDIIPSLIPNFDHSPRSGKYGYIIKNSTPQLFGEYAGKEFQIVSKKKNNIVLLRSWNEWGEGNYMEPDLQWGHGYLDALKEALKNCQE